MSTHQYETQPVQLERLPDGLRPSKIVGHAEEKYDSRTIIKPASEVEVALATDPSNLVEGTRLTVVHDEWQKRFFGRHALLEGYDLRDGGEYPMTVDIQSAGFIGRTLNRARRRKTEAFLTPYTRKIPRLPIDPTAAAA
jgi:hypothetical protein